MLANLLDQNKIKNVNVWKDIRKRAKRKPTEWKEIFAMHILAKVFYSKFKILPLSHLTPFSRKTSPLPHCHPGPAFFPRQDLKVILRLCFQLLFWLLILMLEGPFPKVGAYLEWCRALIIFFLTASVYFWMLWVFTATQGLSLIVESGGYSLAAVHRLLVEVASFGAEHGV